MSKTKKDYAVGKKGKMKMMDDYIEITFSLPEMDVLLQLSEGN